MRRKWYGLQARGAGEPSESERLIRTALDQTHRFRHARHGAGGGIGPVRREPARHLCSFCRELDAELLPGHLRGPDEAGAGPCDQGRQRTERGQASRWEEGHGPGAWHGADLKAALADVSADLAFWRPGTGRHNIAEIAPHHAYCARSVRGQLSGQTPEPFVLEGEDWFARRDEVGLDWPRIRGVVETEQGHLAAVLADVAAARTKSPLADAERFELVLGVTCHAVYHAGQIQLIKRLHAR